MWSTRGGDSGSIESPSAVRQWPAPDLCGGAARGRASCIVRDVKIVVVEPGMFGVESCRAFLILAGAFPAPVLGLPTGKTPVPLYETLRERSLLGEISLARFAAPFAIDEYGVSDPFHPCANRAFFPRYWDSIPETTPVRQFDPAASDREAEAGRMAGEIAAAGGLDLAVLGIGLNGHLAFNEPGSERSAGTRVVELSPESRSAAARCFGEVTPAWGLTLGLKELLGAKRVLLLANGGAKAAIMARALEGDVGPECPASFLREHADVTVLLDADAARLLSH
ncbi:MAG: glucosamine-6-phosphate deaminase [Anaerolinea sp.]|nr:glucosamine-6-phosphate deaminase [Anaerolinea sp.]